MNKYSATLSHVIHMEFAWLIVSSHWVNHFVSVNLSWNPICCEADSLSRKPWANRCCIATKVKSAVFHVNRWRNDWATLFTSFCPQQKHHLSTKSATFRWWKLVNSIAQSACTPQPLPRHVTWLSNILFEDLFNISAMPLCLGKIKYCIYMNRESFGKLCTSNPSSVWLCSIS